MQICTPNPSRSANPCRTLGISLRILDVFAVDLSQEDVTGIIIQNPGTSGQLRDLGPIIATTHAQQGLVAVATDLLACT